MKEDLYDDAIGGLLDGGDEGSETESDEDSDSEKPSGSPEEIISMIRRECDRLERMLA